MVLGLSVCILHSGVARAHCHDAPTFHFRCQRCSLPSLSTSPSFYNLLRGTMPCRILGFQKIMKKDRVLLWYQHMSQCQSNRQCTSIFPSLTRPNWEKEKLVASREGFKHMPQAPRAQKESPFWKPGKDKKEIESRPGQDSNLCARRQQLSRLSR